MGEVCTGGAPGSHTVALEHVSSPTSAWAGPGLFLQNPDPTNLLLEGDSPSSTSCGQGGSSGRRGAAGVRLCLPMGHGGWRPRPAKMTRRTQISPHPRSVPGHPPHSRVAAGRRGTTPLSDSAQDIDPRLATEALGREVLQHPFRQEDHGGDSHGGCPTLPAEPESLPKLEDVARLAEVGREQSGEGDSVPKQRRRRLVSV